MQTTRPPHPATAIRPRPYGHGHTRKKSILGITGIEWWYNDSSTDVHGLPGQQQQWRYLELIFLIMRWTWADCIVCLNESFRFVCLPWFRWTRNIYSTFFGGPRKTSQPTGRPGSKTSSISALAATMRLAAISNPTFRVWDAKMIFDGCWWLGVFGPSGSWELAVIGGRIVNKNLIFLKRRWCLWTEVEACAMAVS